MRTEFLVLCSLSRPRTVPGTHSVHKDICLLSGVLKPSKPGVNAFTGAKLTINILEKIIHADLIAGKTKCKSALIYLLSTGTLYTA